MMTKPEQRIAETLQEPAKIAEVFEMKNWICFINQNAMS